jgi:hypothetical protein
MVVEVPSAPNDVDNIDVVHRRRFVALVVPDTVAGAVVA